MPGLTGRPHRDPHARARRIHRPAKLRSRSDFTRSAKIPDEAILRDDSPLKKPWILIVDVDGWFRILMVHSTAQTKLSQTLIPNGQCRFWSIPHHFSHASVALLLWWHQRKKNKKGTHQDTMNMIQKSPELESLKLLSIFLNRSTPILLIRSTPILLIPQCLIWRFKKSGPKIRILAARRRLKPVILERFVIEWLWNHPWCCGYPTWLWHSQFAMENRWP